MSIANRQTGENTRREIVSETRWSLQPIPPYFANTFDVVAEHDTERRTRRDRGLARHGLQVSSSR